MNCKLLRNDIKRALLAVTSKRLMGVWTVLYCQYILTV